MISAPTGGNPKVIGSSIAMVATVPIPGRTPTSVPTRAPSRQNAMFIGENATPKPNARFDSSSDMAPIPSLASRAEDELQQRSEHEPEELGKLIVEDHMRVRLWPQLERQVEQVDEQQDAEQRHDHRTDNALDPFHLARSHDREDE